MDDTDRSEATGWMTIDACGCCGGRGSRSSTFVRGIERVRCTTCGTTRFTSVAPPAEIYRDGYHDGSADYGWDSTSGDSGAYESFVADLRLAVIERHVRPGSIVDVGGGLGYFTAAAKRRGWDALLLEPVPRAVAHARQQLGVDAVEGGTEWLETSGRRWDVLAFNHVLEHLPDVLDALRRSRDAVSPHGIVYVELPNLNSVSRLLERDRWFGWQPGQHVYLFTRRTLRGLLERAGYEVLSMGTFVPGWQGLTADAYAHFLGVERLMNLAVDLRRSVASRRRGAPGSASTDASRGNERPDAPVPLAEVPGAKGSLLRLAFPALGRTERIAHVGTDLVAVARPRR